jgi:large subunit ribosomal protein L29
MPRPKILVNDLTVDEVQQKLAELKNELFNLRFRNTMRQLDDPLKIRFMRRDIARLSTALSESRHGIHTLAGEARESKES